jgi:methylthioribose-1-phosphate isomerase
MKTCMQTISWHNGAVKLIDQSILPRRLRYITVRNVKDLWHAIKTLKVRGAPALGAAAALGVYLGIKDSRAKNFNQFSSELDRVTKYLASSRPTARNLFWGLERMCSIAVRHRASAVPHIKKLLLAQAQLIIEEDRQACRAIGANGARLIKDKDSILTICNAGILATIDYGTALGVLYKAAGEGKNIKVYACETRPVLQGARLTAWELKQNGIDTTLLCDSMAGTLMQQGKIDKVIVGADRIAANGDTANKIGTYTLAVLARAHGIPFYVAAPVTTFDPGIASGKKIVIENRPAQEVTQAFFKKPVAPQGVDVFNPAFDVTPHWLITAIITDRGVIKPPYRSSIKRITHT